VYAYHPSKGNPKVMVRYTFTSTKKIADLFTFRLRQKTVLFWLVVFASFTNQSTEDFSVYMVNINGPTFKTLWVAVWV